MMWPLITTWASHPACSTAGGNPALSKRQKWKNNRNTISSTLQCNEEMFSYLSCVNAYFFLPLFSLQASPHHAYRFFLLFCHFQLESKAKWKCHEELAKKLLVWLRPLGRLLNSCICFPALHPPCPTPNVSSFCRKAFRRLLRGHVHTECLHKEGEGG